MPAEIPDDEKILPSSTQRASGTQITLGPVEIAQAQDRLLVVARRLSRMEARERSVAPVQTDMMYLSWSKGQLNSAMAKKKGTYRRRNLPLDRRPSQIQPPRSFLPCAHAAGHDEDFNVASWVAGGAYREVFGKSGCWDDALSEIAIHMCGLACRRDWLQCLGED